MDAQVRFMVLWFGVLALTAVMWYVLVSRRFRVYRSPTRVLLVRVVAVIVGFALFWLLWSGR